MLSTSKILSVFLYIAWLTLCISIMACIPVLINIALRYIYAYLNIPYPAPQIDFVLPTFLQPYIYTDDEKKVPLTKSDRLKKLLNGILFIIFLTLYFYYCSYVFSFYYEFNACGLLTKAAIHTAKVPLFFKPFYYALARKGDIFMHLLIIGLPFIPVYIFYMFTLRSEYKKIFFIFFIIFLINFFFLHIFSLLFF